MAPYTRSGAKLDAIMGVEFFFGIVPDPKDSGLQDAFVCGNNLHR